MPSSNRLLRERITDALRDRIVNGTLIPGARLREEQIAAEFNVSRVPVREALQRLEREGFVELTPRRGATVIVPSPGRVYDLLEVQAGLEVWAAVLAARRHGDGATPRLAAIADEGKALAAAGDFAQIPALIEEFHDVVARASGNLELVKTLKATRGRVRWMFEFDIEGRSPDIWSAHERIAQAISAGDEKAAAAEMADDTDPTRALAAWTDVQRRKSLDV